MLCIALLALFLSLSYGAVERTEFYEWNRELIPGTTVHESVVIYDSTIVMTSVDSCLEQNSPFYPASIRQEFYKTRDPVTGAYGKIIINVRRLKACFLTEAGYSFESTRDAVRHNAQIQGPLHVVFNGLGNPYYNVTTAVPSSYDQSLRDFCDGLEIFQLEPIKYPFHWPYAWWWISGVVTSYPIGGPVLYQHIRDNLKPASP